MKKVNKSEMIMNAYNEMQGKSIKEIKERVNKELKKKGEKEVSYNMCYNVISRYCMKDGVEMNVDRSAKGEVKRRVIELSQEGKSVKEICMEIGTWESYVRGVRKEAGIK